MTTKEVLFEIKKAKELEYEQLDLGYENLNELPAEIGQLTNLKELYLHGNQLEILPKEIGNLSQLETLKLKYNKLKKFPEGISDLKNLKMLEINNNQIKKLPPEIGNLENLLKLDITGNQLESLPPEIGKLRNLQKLHISNNQLRELPVEIGNLSQLRILGLVLNQLTQLPASIGQLTNLKQIHAWINRLTTLPGEIGQLTQLEYLNLDKNQLKCLPVEIENLKQLQSLSLWGNKIKELPIGIGKLTRLKRLILDNNPLKKPPLSIVSQGIPGIWNYYQSLNEQGKEYISLYEAKLILIGEPEAGKTTLAQKLKNPDYPLNPSESPTEGIDIINWYFDIPGGIFQTNIWDFGGQEIMYSTHRYFLTHRSLYIIVADNRREETDFYYWLNIITSLSENNPIIIVINLKHQYPKYVPDYIRDSFKNIVDVFIVNLADNSGLSALTKKIKKEICKLPHVGKELIPAKWKKIREELKSKEENYISRKDFLKICNKYEISEEQKALKISEYLHDLGVVLHFQNDCYLKDYLILNPNWATKAVYLVLLDAGIIKKYGEFINADLERIWNQPEYKFNHAVLLNLMIKFKLCYEYDQNRNRKKYIISELLSEIKPEKNYPDPFRKPGQERMINFEYWYRFMPKGIMSQLIVKMNRYIYNQLLWKNGVILKHENTYAEIIEQNYERKLKIRLFGNEKNTCLKIIRETINEIHTSFEYLSVYEMVECACKKCKATGHPFFYKYKYLKRCLKNNRENVRCKRSLLDVEIKEILKGKIIKRTRQKVWDVFISYSTRDKDKIKEMISNCLKIHNISYWLDEEQIQGGDKILEKIEEGLKNSRCFMLCLSKNQQQSGWSRNEFDAVINYTINNKDHNLKIIPLIIDDLDPSELPIFIQNYNHIKLSEESACDNIIASINI